MAMRGGGNEPQRLQAASASGAGCSGGWATSGDGGSMRACCRARQMHATAPRRLLGVARFPCKSPDPPRAPRIHTFQRSARCVDRLAAGPCPLRFPLAGRWSRPSARAQCSTQESVCAAPSSMAGVCERSARSLAGSASTSGRPLAQAPTRATLWAARPRQRAARRQMGVEVRAAAGSTTTPNRCERRRRRLLQPLAFPLQQPLRARLLLVCLPSGSELLTASMVSTAPAPAPRRCSPRSTAAAGPWLQLQPSFCLPPPLHPGAGRSSTSPGSTSGARRSRSCRWRCGAGAGPAAAAAAARPRLPVSRRRAAPRRVPPGPLVL